MIFDRARPDHAYTDPCVLLGPHLPRAAAGGPRDLPRLSSRKSVGFRLLCIHPCVCLPGFLSAGIFVLMSAQNEFLEALLLLSQSSVHTLPIGGAAAPSARAS
jgi:hypothetical protein